MGEPHMGEDHGKVSSPNILPVAFSVVVWSSFFYAVFLVSSQGFKAFVYIVLYA